MIKNKKATWIWYPGDFEVWLGNKFNNRRTERGSMFPPFWKQDSHWPTVEFSTEAEIKDKMEEIFVWTEGKFNFMLDGKLLSEEAAPDVILREPDTDRYRISVPQGKHRLSFKVWNQQTPPALYADGDTVKSGNHWLCTYEDKIWIDENGVAHGSGIYVPAACWNFDEPNLLPSHFSLPWRDRLPIAVEQVGKGTLYDFGCETFGILDFRPATGDGTLNIYYGESREEALDKERCETLDINRIIDGTPLWTPHANRSKAFRYVYIETTGTASFELTMKEEYAPFNPQKSGSFCCNDSELNRIWQVSAYTMELTTREFFVDGIKRDRWVWSGDAVQSYLMNYYLHFDTECVKRTIRQLRGHDPVTAHVNTIMDYTFYWFVSIGQYYDYTGDLEFLREMYPKMVTLMDYVLSRTNSDGMAEGQPDDWIFVDWVDFPMHKRGTLCFEQILLWKALDTMSRCTSLLSTNCALRFYRNDYAAMARTLSQRIHAVFFSDDNHAFLHAIEDGELNPQITKFPNMFAILYDFATQEEKQQIMEQVMLNTDIAPITTPYMRFYELDALCKMGQHNIVLNEIKTYWSGMLREGATTIWEKYNPDESGTQHLAMYGRPYGKSLCHAWGASPIYLLGRHFLGVRPTKPGYEEYEVCPRLGGLEWLKGNVPTPFGLIRIDVSKDSVTVKSDGGKGTLILGTRKVAIPIGQEVTLKL
jgi:hypothetical protein